MLFYTRHGDKGETGLLGSGRVAKNNVVIETLGAIDEAGAALAVARSQCRKPGNAEILLQIQRDLGLLLADVASSYAEPDNQWKKIEEQHVNWVEEQIDLLENTLPKMKGFIIPGDRYSAALLDVARTVVRRAERRMVALDQMVHFHNPQVLRYLNRLSSLCFVLERSELTED